MRLYIKHNVNVCIVRFGEDEPLNSNKSARSRLARTSEGELEEIMMLVSMRQG